jgi:iron complex transport system ATP-binding protein
LSPKLKTEVETILARCGLTKSSDLSIGELSGGQRQRTMIAAALVKNPKVLLLDEPTTSLDYAHQLEVINLLSSLKRERNMIILAVIHDLNLAARFADRVLILKNGEILADGDAGSVITPTNMAEAFNILARVIEDPVAKTPMVIPIRQLVNQ